MRIELGSMRALDACVTLIIHGDYPAAAPLNLKQLRLEAEYDQIMAFNYLREMVELESLGRWTIRHADRQLWSDLPADWRGLLLARCRPDFPVHPAIVTVREPDMALVRLGGVNDIQLSVGLPAKDGLVEIDLSAGRARRPLHVAVRAELDQFLLRLETARQDAAVGKDVKHDATTYSIAAVAQLSPAELDRFCREADAALFELMCRITKPQ
jgi:hypothetical protein